MWAGSPRCSLLSSLDCESSALCRVVVAISKSFRGVLRAADEVEGPWGFGALLQTRAAEGRTIRERGCCVGPPEGRAAARLVKTETSSLESLFSHTHTHTLTVKMYFRETCKFFCTVLIICSILSCRNHCDMSSIK